MTLESSQVAVATLNPAKAFGASAFGPLQYRVRATRRHRRLATSGDLGAPAGAEGHQVPCRRGAGV